MFLLSGEYGTVPAGAVGTRLALVISMPGQCASFMARHRSAVLEGLACAPPAKLS
jgi:hypothetical protein